MGNWSMEEHDQMSATEIVTHYESLSHLTSQMREAAEQGKWDVLLDLEHRCSQHVETMKPVDAVAALDESGRERKAQLIKKILTDEAVIRNRTEVWMEQLQRIMHSNRQEQRLQDAYSGGQ
jgi:flagellar protein FliT